MERDPLGAVFGALANAHRRQMLDVVKASPGCNVGHVAAHFGMSRIAVMKHLKVLQAARLLISERRGRERALWFNTVPIQQIHDRWTSEFSALWAAKLTRIKYAIENPPDAPEREPPDAPRAG